MVKYILSWLISNRGRRPTASFKYWVQIKKLIGGVSQNFPVTLDPTLEPSTVTLQFSVIKVVWLLKDADRADTRLNVGNKLLKGVLIVGN